MAVVRQYIVFDAKELLGRAITGSLELDEVENALVGALGPGLSFAVESLPWAKFIPYEEMNLPFIPQSVAVLVSPSEAAAYAVRSAVEALIVQEGGKRISAVGADPAIGMADYSFPGSTEPDIFATRADADRLIGLNCLPPGLTGNDVNVVVIDFGLDQSLIPPGQWGGGLQLLPRWPPAGNDNGENVRCTA